MYSSPGTPSGCGLERRVQHVELGVGDRLARAVSVRRPVAPRLHRRPDRRLGRPVHVPERLDASAECRGQLRGSASPPHSTLRPGVPAHPASSSSCHVAGVACITVMSAAPSRSRSQIASMASSSPASTMRGADW